MKSAPFAILLLSASFLTGCIRYQYFSVSSELPTQLDGSLKFEDDTVKVVYSFSRYGNINVEITNKLDELIYVDWERSAMIFGSEGYAFSDGKVSFEGSSSSYKLSDNFQTGSFSGTLVSSPNRRYISPKTKVSHQFKDVPIGYKDLKALEWDELTLPGGTAVKRYSFDNNNSVNTFQSYLYLSDANNTKAHILKHNFCVSYIIETFDEVRHLPLNQFERSRLNPAGGILATAGLAGVIIIGVQMGDNITDR